MPIASATNETKLQRLERQGKLYYVSTVLPAQSAAVKFLWRVGAKPLNFTAAFSSTLKTTYTIEAGVTVTNAGTVGALLNRNRNYPDDGLLFKRYTGFTYTGGTLISTDQTGSTSAPGQSVQSPASNEEATLKANTDYVITITPSAANDISVDVLWWED